MLPRCKGGGEWGESARPAPAQKYRGGYICHHLQKCAALWRYIGDTRRKAAVLLEFSQACYLTT